VGQGIANPIAMIWSGAMMLNFLGQTETADLMMSAIKTLTSQGRVLSPDLGGQARTIQVGDEIVAHMRVS
jgi:tartrate dehydrogenase/decarboxylase/D-malate dehydrogenase